jgi:hypothetical protein
MNRRANWSLQPATTWARTRSAHAWRSARAPWVTSHAPVSRCSSRTTQRGRDAPRSTRRTWCRRCSRRRSSSAAAWSAPLPSCTPTWAAGSMTARPAPARDVRPQAAIAIENARLFSAERRRAEEQQALLETMGTWQANSTWRELLERVLERIVALLGVTGGELAMYDEFHDDLVIMASHNMEHTHSAPAWRWARAPWATWRSRMNRSLSRGIRIGPDGRRSTDRAASRAWSRHRS